MARRFSCWRPPAVGLTSWLVHAGVVERAPAKLGASCPGPSGPGRDLRAGTWARASLPSAPARAGPHSGGLEGAIGRSVRPKLRWLPCHHATLLTVPPCPCPPSPGGATPPCPMPHFQHAPHTQGPCQWARLRAAVGTSGGQGRQRHTVLTSGVQQGGRRCGGVGAGALGEGRRVCGTQRRTLQNSQKQRKSAVYVLNSTIIPIR